MQYNSDKYFLGSICKYGHEYETSGKGLRYKSDHNCIECASLHNKKYRDSDKEKAKSLGKYYLGIICKRKHEYNSSGMSMRYVNGGTCIECRKIGSKKLSMKYYNSEKGQVTCKKYRSSEKGKTTANKIHKKYIKYQQENHTQAAIKELLRGHVYAALKKYSETGKIRLSDGYGIIYEAIIKHLGPHPNTLGIKGKFHIDHKYPLSLFNLNKPEHIKVAFDSLNHQWLSAEENLKKGNKIPDASEIPKALIIKLNSVGLEI